MIHTVVITGASKGFGRALAKAIAHSSEPNIHVVLSGRNQSDLNEARNELLEIRHERNKEISCDLVVGDASNMLELENIANSLFGESTLYKDSSSLASITFINNAGSLGPLTSIGSEHATLLDLSHTINLNVTSSMYLTSEFVRRYEAQPFTQGSAPRATVVNISSLAAQQPFPSWGIYCAGKAARDMYHRVLAEEQRAKWQDTDTSSEQRSRAVRVLNYAPGPLDTDMQSQIRAAEHKDSRLGTVYTDMKRQNLLVDPVDSAQKLLHLLRHPHTYRCGDHIDYYDDMSLTANMSSDL